MEILGLIPARGGSKSIPHKNITLLCGKPLLAYTCESSRKSRYLTRLIASTDDKEIADVARLYGAEIPFFRPKTLSQDHTPALPVILHTLQELERRENYRPDIVVLLQPTSPLRKAAHIDQAIEILQSTKADSVVSVTEVPHHFNPVSVMKLRYGRLKPFTSGKLITRRQEKPKMFSRNGPAILAVRREILIKKKSLYGSDIRPLFMAPEESIDIDTLLDLDLAEFFLKRSQRRL